jgi:hypothetical protein
VVGNGVSKAIEKLIFTTTPNHVVVKQRLTANNLRGDSRLMKAVDITFLMLSIVILVIILFF